MKLHHFTHPSLVLFLSLASAPAAVLSNPAITSVSSQFSGAFAASFLFDGNPVFGATSGQGNQWAGAGVGPHTISFDFGAAKNIGGKIKEGVGKLTGDTKMQAEGKADQVEGKVQNAVGGLKDTLRDDKRN